MIYMGSYEDKIDSYWDTIEHPTTGKKLHFQFPVSESNDDTPSVWFSTDKTERYVLYVHYQLEKELLWRFQTENPDKILLPGLQPVGDYFIADYLPLEWQECIPNPNEFAEFFHEHFHPWEKRKIWKTLERKFKIAKTLRNAREFLKYAQDYVEEYQLDFWVIENFRGNKRGSIFWFDPIVKSDSD